MKVQGKAVQQLSGCLPLMRPLPNFGVTGVSRMRRGFGATVARVCGAVPFKKEAMHPPRARFEPAMSPPTARLQPASSQLPARLQPASSPPPARIQPASNPLPARLQFASSPLRARLEAVSSPPPAHLRGVKHFQAIRRCPALLYAALAPAVPLRSLVGPTIFLNANSRSLAPS